MRKENGKTVRERGLRGAVFYRETCLCAFVCLRTGSRNVYTASRFCLQVGMLVILKESGKKKERVGWFDLGDARVFVFDIGSKMNVGLLDLVFF